MWIERSCSDLLLEAVKTRPAVLLTGMRQSGKSSLLKHLFPKSVYVTLDDFMLAREAAENPGYFLKRFDNEKQVIIDEIQYAPDLLREVKIIIDNNRETYGKWIFTGSQRFSLMDKITESLAGRVSIIELSTLSTAELKSKSINFSTDEILIRGGFPELWKNRSINSNNFYSDYIKTYMERDIRSILNIGTIGSFQKFIQLLAMRAANILNYTELARDASVAPNTVKSWLAVLESSGVITTVQPYFNNMGKRLIKSPKVFFSDTGLLCHLLRISSSSGLRQLPYFGQIWENFAVSEIIKTASLNQGTSLYYFRDSNGVEIDLLVIKDGIVTAIEAKSSEKPDAQKFNFKKVLPLFRERGFKTKAIIAAPVVQGKISLEKYTFINPAMESII